MDRRAFNKVCTSLIAGAAGLSRNAHASEQRSFPRSRLVDDNDNPLQADALSIGSSHVFHYPYVTTPCFLIRLATTEQSMSQSDTELRDRAGNIYHWRGGVGEDSSIVAFSAICSHKMTHPAKPISHLNFRSESKDFIDHEGNSRQQSQVIMCCSEHSIYDPSQGAKVLSGPASQPLASIALEVNSRGELIATGSYGGDMYDSFLDKFGFRLAMEAGVTDARTSVGETTRAIAADRYSQQQIKC